MGRNATVTSTLLAILLASCGGGAAGSPATSGAPPAEESPLPGASAGPGGSPGAFDVVVHPDLAGVALAVDGAQAWTADGDTSVSAIDLTSGAASGRFELEQSPYALAAAEGSLWVATAEIREGAIRRLDPATGASEATVLLADAYPIRVAAGEGAVWVTVNGRGDAMRIDTASNSAGPLIAIGAQPDYSYDASDLVVAFGAVWTIDNTTGRLNRIDAATGTLAATIDGLGYLADTTTDASGGTTSTIWGPGPQALGADERGIWVVSAAADRAADGQTIQIGRLYFVDPASNTVKASFDLTSTPSMGSHGLVVAAGYAWYLDDTGMARVDLATGADEAIITDVTVVPAAVAAGSDRVWFVSEFGPLAGVKP